MSEVTVITYSPESDTVDEYIRWKRARKDYIKKVGLQLLDMPEQDVWQFLEQWETKARELVKSESQNSQILIGLLYLSVVTEFNQMLGQFTDLVPILCSFVGNLNRSISCAASRIISQLCSNSADNVNFFHDLFDPIQNWMIGDRNNPEVFCALVVLKKAYRFAPALVGSVVAPRVDKIHLMVQSNDIVIQDLALSVLRNHTRTNRTYHENQIMQSCIESITPDQKKPVPLRGSLLFIDFLVKEQIINTRKLLEEIVQRLLLLNTSDNDQIMCLAYEIIANILPKDAYEWKKTKTRVIIDNLSCSIRCYPDNRDLSDKMKTILSLIPKNFLAQDQLVSFTEDLFRETSKNAHNFGYWLLGMIVDNFPDIPIKDLQVPFDPTLSKEFRRLLKKRPVLLIEYQTRLNQIIETGLKNGAPERELIKALRVIRISKGLSIEMTQNIKTRVSVAMSSKSDIVRLEAIKVMQKLEPDNTNVLYAAMFDDWEKIRVVAVKCLAETTRPIREELTGMLLADESIEVRSRALELCYEIYDMNPMTVMPYYYTFMQELMKRYARAEDLQIASQLSTLFPQTAKLCMLIYPDFVPTLLRYCMCFLTRGAVKMDVMSEVNTSALLDPFRNSKDSVKGHIFCLHYSPYRDICDANLLKTIQVMKDMIDSELIAEVIKIQLNEKRSEQVQMALVDLVNELVPMNHETLMEQVVKLLFKLFGQTESSKVSVELLKFFGKMGITTIPQQETQGTENAAKISTNSSQSIEEFVCEGTFKALCSLLPNPPPTFFQAATSVIVRNKTRSYMGKIVPEFIKVLKASRGEFEHQIMQQLIDILKETKNAFIPYLDMLAPILKERLGENQCLQMCIALSRTLYDNFVPVIGQLYESAATFANSTRNETVLKNILKFLSSAIIFQNQRIDIFMNVCETLTDTLPHPVCHEMLRVLQNSVEARPYCGWMLRLAVRMVPISMQVIYSLMVYGRVPWNMVKFTLGNLTDENIESLRDYASIPRTDIPEFITIIPPGNNYKSVVQKEPLDVKNPLGKFGPPINNNIDKWFQDFVIMAVSNSPNEAIRSCINLAHQSEEFRRSILAPAFITCWSITNEADKPMFLDIFSYVLETYQVLPSCLFELVDILDAQKLSFPIAHNILARAASNSPAMAHFYWSRHFMETHKNAEMYLKHCLEIGKIDTAKGILATTGSDLTLMNLALWNEHLGNWQEALSMYDKDNYECVVRCLGNLEEWSEVCNLFTHFGQMSDPAKGATSLWFAWGFYYEGNLSKAKELIGYFPEEETIEHTFLKLLILVKSQEYDKAENVINSEFHRIASAKNFNTSDLTRTEQQFMYIQHLVEISEVIECKRNGISKPPASWNYRQSLVERTRDCRELTNIRSLLLPDDERMKISLKMVSALRKGRNWNTFKGVYRRMDVIEELSDVPFEGIKMLWARNMKKSAITLMSILVNCLTDYSEEFVDKQIETLSASDMHLFVNLKDASRPEMAMKFRERIRNFVSSDHFEDRNAARAIRLLAEWKMQELPQTRDSIIENVKSLETAMKLKPNDPKILFDYALFMTRAVEIEPNDTLVLTAIKAFVKVIGLGGSLSPLLLLLNVIANFGNDNIMSDPVFDAIKHLPHTIIATAMPQLENMISHQSLKLREYVRSILLDFGKNGFQSLFYSLNIGMQSSDPVRSQISTEVYEKLIVDDFDLADEMQLFVQGLRKAAISTLEVWRFGIENARKAFDSGNESSMVSILTNLLYILDHPTCELDRTFKKIIDDFSKGFRESFSRFCKGERRYLTQMWGSLHSVFENISHKLGQLAVINLHNVCEKLASKRGFRVFIPGNDNEIRIQSISPVLKVFSTAFHPRFLSFVGQDGNNYNFLLKGNCDVRIDYRIMQFFKLANTFLGGNRVTADQSITIYSIVPFTSDAGIISWVENADSLHQIINDFRENRAAEGVIMRDHCGSCNVYMNGLQLYELHGLIVSQTKANEIARYLWLKTRDASLWMKNSETYVKSLALMSVCGYIIGLGDRHPSNIMIQKHNGKIAHIDFGDSFETTMKRVSYPEKVPFRLTRMLVNALDGCNPHGIFKRTCQDVLSVMRWNKHTVMAQLELCTRDPMMTNLGFDKVSIIKRAGSKLDGTDFDDDQPLDVEEQVNRLISIAGDPKRYGTHFIGWCPHW